MSRDEFLDKYVLTLEKDFEHNGKVAEWARSAREGPLNWGQEDGVMNLSYTINGSEDGGNYATMALSQDCELLAVAINQEIRIHRFDTKQLIATLIGHLNTIGKILFAPPEVEKPEGAKYLLFSESRPHSKVDEQIVLWHLDKDGRSLDEIKPFDVAGLAEKAVSSIAEDLKSEHGVADSEIEELSKSFQADLKVADTKNRMKSITTINGRLLTNGNFINSLRTHFVTKSRKLQDINGIRRRDKAEDLVIHPLSNLSITSQTLQGHTDNIVWASFSPTDPEILASASWDGSYRIWNTPSGGCLQTIVDETKNQNWTATFSEDRKRLLLAGTNNIGIYSVQSGERLFRLERGEADSSPFARVNAWSPMEDVVAIASGSSVFLWEPGAGKYDEILRLQKDEERIMEAFKRIAHLRWLDEKGEKIWVGLPGDSCAVWDRKRSWKWRMERPKGAAIKLYTYSEVSYLEEQDLLVVLHGDGKIREWKLS